MLPTVGLGLAPAAYLEHAYDAEGVNPLRTTCGITSE